MIPRPRRLEAAGPLALWLAMMAWSAAPPALGQRPDGQQPTPAPTAAQAWHELLGTLSGTAGTRPPPDLPVQQRALTDFVDAHPRGTFAALAWNRLGTLHLRTLQAKAAIGAFTNALSEAADHERDAQGQALYGLFQAHALLGDEASARGFQRRLHTELPKSRYDRYAQIAIRRLDRQSGAGSGLPRPGLVMPPLQLGTDVRANNSPPALDQPWLLVFFHSDVPVSVAEVEDLAAAWTGDQRRSLVAVDLVGESQRSATLAEERKWDFHVVSARDGFLHPDALVLGITAVPTWFVVGRDRRLLGRDVPSARLQRLLQR